MALSQSAYPSAPQDTLGRVPDRHTPPEPGLWTEDDALGVLPEDQTGFAMTNAGNAPPHYAVEDLHARINLPFGNEALPLVWFADDQGGAPPPGAVNDQPFQSGHTSVTVHNQSAEQGYGKDPAFAMARYPHMENDAAAYSWGVARRNGQYLAPKAFTPLYDRTQQARDLTLRQLIVHRLHEVVMSVAPTVPNVINVTPMQPSYAGIDFGEGGVLPG